MNQTANKYILQSLIKINIDKLCHILDIKLNHYNNNQVKIVKLGQNLVCQWGQKDYQLNWEANKKWGLKLNDHNRGFNREIDWYAKTNVTFLKRRPESSLTWAKRGMMLLR